MVNILTLNGGGYITVKRLIESIKLYTQAPYRHIVLIQGDKESQAQLAKEFDNRLHLIFSPVNLSLSIGYNHLIEYSMALSATDYHMFLDDDFLLKCDAIGKLQSFAKSSKSDLVAMEHSWYGNQLQSPFVQECGGGTVMFTKDVFNKVGYIDEAIVHSEWDADWIRRIILCEKMTLAIAPGSKSWARHFQQTGQRRHGMKRFRKLQRISLDYMSTKWGVSGIAGNSLSSTVNSKVLDDIKLRNPLCRQSTLRGSGLILKNGSKVYKL